ncbi:MAG: protein kinase [Lachnospiraceae bacterium]|nr:protein kinase [Lachnospiraceae bacterium]
MAQIIARTYELLEKIGAGGGGVVYLGRHIRLEKAVVLKADKRTLSIGRETLRREVDLLKALSHTYIPQVYDFVQEDGVVYTVMDYIQGESLDKLIARRELPTQAQAVKWACQLLEALQYLHSRPPYGILHGDIKPANIMLRTDGDMCLIDFNIALALGEEGAVKVGFSRGYASPEHYGADYLADNQSAAVGSHSVLKESSFFRRRFGGGDSGKALSDKVQERAALTGKNVGKKLSGRRQDEAAKSFCTETAVLSDGSESTVLLAEKSVSKNHDRSAYGSTTGGDRGILLDVRSDIYSLGATLYHLISGKKPAQDAREVEPLGAEVCSEAVAAIIRKAMAPQPKDRYQTAEDMLADFQRLHRQDRRAVRHRRRMITAAVVLTGGFLAGGVCTFAGLKQMEQRQRALALAEYSANALAEGNVESAVRLALEAISDEKDIFAAPVTAEAQKALTDALGVYDLADGFKAAGTIELPGAPFDLAVSPGGSRLAVVYGYEAAVYDLMSLERTAVLPVQNSALADCMFTDEEHVVFAGQDGVSLYDLAAGKAVWTGDRATTLAVSADGKVIAAVDRDAAYGVIYNAADGVKILECSFQGRHMAVAANDIFADPKDAVFELNGDGSLLAVSFSDGGLRVFDLRDGRGDLAIMEESGYCKFSGGFCGKYFAFAAEGNDSVAEGNSQALFGLADMEEGILTGGMESQDGFLLQADEDGIYAGSGNVLVELNPATLEELEVAFTGSVNMTNFAVGEEYTLVATEEHGFAFYDSGAHLTIAGNGEQNGDFLALGDGAAVIGNRTEPVLRVLRQESHEDAQLFSYDARYVHDEARVGGDGQTVMLFGYEGFRVYDVGGEVLADVKLPEADSIYDQQFRKDGTDSWLEVIWYDGTRRLYSGADGGLLSEETGEAPGKDLYEEFLAGGYRFTSRLHEAPVVYEEISGREMAVLETEGYLTYVTELGDYFITEYIDAEGERYGLLLNRQLETLAYLPGLCDVWGEKLIFDFPSGNLRQCGVYELGELTELGWKEVIEIRRKRKL